MVSQQVSVLIVTKAELKKVLADTSLRYYEDVIILRESDKCKVVKDRTGYFVCDTVKIRR